MKKKRSLRWQLTLLSGLLTIVACLILSYAISASAILSMSEIENSVITVLPQEAIATGDSAHTDLHLDITGDLSEQVQDAKSQFWQKSLLITLLITLASSALTYYIVGYALKPLHRFSANAAHEMRTPLAIMQAKIDVFQKQSNHSPEEYADVMEMMQTQTGRLSHVIEVLLDMTELRAMPKNDRISLAELSEEVICDLTPLAQKNGIKIYQQDGDAEMSGSYMLVYRAVYNLLENAIKYNQQGGKVNVEIVNDSRYVRLFISDTGLGIAAKDRDKIFEPFFRADKAKSRSMGGAGLGLALVKEIAHQHGGGVRIIDSSAYGTRIELYMLH